MKAVILAAGEGTRLNKGWTIVPKPLLEVGDKTIIEHVITSLKNAGLNEIVIVTGFMSEHIKDRLRDGTDLGVNIEYIYNKDYKGDLVTSLLLVKEQVKGRFLLCMSDLFFNSSLIKNLISNSSDTHHHVCIDTKISQVRKIEEKVKIRTLGSDVKHASLVLPEYDAVDLGIYIMQESIFPAIEKYLEQGKRSLPLIMTELSMQGLFKTHNIGEEVVVDIDREKDAKYVLDEVYKNAKE